jgi:mannitol/fructose-specific phosphotransferase system IIA component (Ntr-type)
MRTKQQAIAAVLDRLVEAGALDLKHRQGVLAAILKREDLGSTGIGGGLAVPHAKFSALAISLYAVAVFKMGVDFGSHDGQLVHVVCLIVSPIDLPAEHLAALGTAAKLVGQEC